MKNTDYRIHSDLILFQRALDVQSDKLNLITKALLEAEAHKKRYKAWTLVETNIINDIKYKFVKDQNWPVASLIRFYQFASLN